LTITGTTCAARRFRRTRNYGFYTPTPNSFLQLLHLILRIRIPPIQMFKTRPAMSCPCCGGDMKIIRTLLPTNPALLQAQLEPTQRERRAYCSCKQSWHLF